MADVRERLLPAQALLAITLVAGCGSQVAPPDARQQAGAADYGISASAPSGWHLRISRGALQAASFPLPQDPRQVGYRTILERLGRDDSLVIVFENDPELDSPSFNVTEYERRSTP